MAATTETTQTVNVFNNSSLFSNHYLENMIKGSQNGMMMFISVKHTCK